MMVLEQAVDEGAMSRSVQREGPGHGVLMQTFLVQVLHELKDKGRMHLVARSRLAPMQEKLLDSKPIAQKEILISS
jgi:hypothetical protein